MVFDVEWQNLKCTHCASSVGFDIIKAPFVKKEYKATSTITSSMTEYTEYVCQTCGRKHVVKKDEPLSNCPSCGDDNLKKVIRVDYTPDGIIPFKVDKNTATKNFFNWVKRRRLSPNMLKNLDRTQRLVGMYVPVYFYDFQTSSTYSGVGIRHYTDKEGKTHTRRENFHKVSRSEYVDYIQSAGQEVPSHTLKMLGSFDTTQLNVYSPEYLYGWIGAEVTSFVKDNYNDMTEYLSHSIASSLKFALPYDSVENFECYTVFSNVRYSYVYVPVYKGSYKYKDKNYTYYVNGQNGTITGKSPKSFWKIFGIAILLALGIAGVALLLTLLT